MSANSIQRLRGPKREAHARRVLGRLTPSGLSKAEFCRREGISTVTLGRWQEAFGAAAPASASEGFVEVRLDRGAAREGFELELASGRHLRIPPGFAATDLERLLVVIERSAC